MAEVGTEQFIEACQRVVKGAKDQHAKSYADCGIRLATGKLEGPAKILKAVQDTKECMGDENFNRILAEFAAGEVQLLERFRMMLSFAGVQGYPVEALHQFIWGIKTPDVKISERHAKDIAENREVEVEEIHRRIAEGELSRRDAIDHFLEWNGIIGWTDTIIELCDSTRRICK